MNTAVATAEAAKSLEQSIKTARADLGQAVGEIGVMVATAKAMSLIEKALTDEIMKDFMSLMGSSHGFKADRPNKNDSTFYSIDEVRKVMIDGFLKGAKCVGNEINIITGECYLTKNFYDRKIKQLKTVKGFKGNIGVAVMASERTAVLPGVAEWIEVATGEVHTLELTDQRPDGHDFRIMVNAWKGSSPDELHGKGESKLWRRAYKQMTGDDIDDEPTSIDGSVVPASQFEKNKPKAIESKADAKPTKELAESIAKIPAAFAPFGVTIPMLEAKLGHPIGELDQNGVTVLTNIYNAIKTSEVNAFDVFEFPPIDEGDIRKRFAGLKSKSGISKAGVELCGRGADADMVEALVAEYQAALKGGE